ncbi:MAG: pheromone shutdown protein [Leptospiraceae bacterium]|nr:MAG: pheromone shutdown protein [Leptospiraceae bacterium]
MERITKKNKNLNINGPYEIIKFRKNKKTIAEVLLLGTAHVSKESVQDVENAIKYFKPDIICVELCEPRHESLLNPDRWKSLDITKVIKENKIALLASNLILSSFQKKVGLKTGAIPGAEMLTASKIARKNHIRLILIDREIRTTLLRAWHNINLWNKLWLINYLFISLLFAESITEEQIEDLKKKDVLEDLFENLPKKYKHIKDIILTERDQYMAENIRRVIYDIDSVKEYQYEHPPELKKNKIKRILVVIGAGHLKGISNYLKQNKQFDLEKLTYIPKKRSLRTILSWILLSIIIGIITYLFFIEGKSAQELVIVWALSRSIGAGLGAIIALAHPLTILVTMIMAPFSVFIPGSRLWMFSALIEVWLNKPRVEDFERIAEDTLDLKSTFKAFYKNRVLKLFWIITMVSTGLTIGNLTFLQRLIEKIINIMF